MNISILICTYNRSHAIRDSLKSIGTALQNVPNLKTELIIIDNNSTDDTSATIKSWIENNKEIKAKLLLEKKQGLSHARNCGLRNSTGDLVIFTDDDCRMTPNYIEKAYAMHKKDKKPVFRGGNVQLGDPKDFPVSIRTGTQLIECKLEENTARHQHMGALLMGCNMIIPREIINNIGDFDTRLGAGTNLFGAEDTDYYYRAYLAGYVVQYVPGLSIIHYHGRKTMTDVHDIKRGYLIGTGALYTKYIFKHFNLCRPLIWDLKALIKELITFKNLYIPDAKLSYKHMFYYMGKGCLRYSIKVILNKN